MSFVLLGMAATVLLPLILGAPIALALGGAGIIWLILADPNYLRGAAYAVWNTSTSDVLTAVPLFILMGEIIQRSRLAHRFYDASGVFVRWLPGGLLHANIGVCAMFAAVSGSSVATAATIGTAAIPNLRRLGYDKKLTLGTLAAGGTLGILIPPSVPLIIYGALVEESIGRLFVAAVIPGAMLAGAFMLYVLIRSILNEKIKPATQSQGVTWREIAFSAREMLPLFFITFVILGALYFGWATPTEAAALGILISIVTAWAHGALSVRLIIDSVKSVTLFSGMLILVILSAQIFAFAVFTWGINNAVAGYVDSLAYPSFVILTVIVGIYIVLGMFIDTISAMVMTVSVVHPVIVSLGYDPVWFGIILVILLEVGLITPPVGMNLFTIKGIDPDGSSLGELARAALPFVFIMLAGIAVLTAFPQIVLWLPGQMYR